MFPRKQPRRYKRYNLHMCTGQSYPIIAVIVVERPTIVAVPELIQPPELLNSVKTASALFLGPKTHSGIMIINRPVIWMTRIRASTKGNFFAKKVLNTTENAVIAIVIMVPCHAWKT